MFIALILLALLPILFPINKIVHKEDITVFDIIILFSALYFCIVPLKDFTVNHYFPDLLNNYPTAIALCIYMWGLYVIDKCTKKKKIYNLTKLLSEIGILKVSESFLWLCLIVIFFFLYQTTNFSALDVDNIEGNNSWGSGANLPFYKKMFVISIKPVLPSLLLITFYLKPRSSFYRKLRFLILAMMIIALLIGGKTYALFLSVFLLLFAYSKYREQIRRKHVILLSVGLVFFFFVYFPLNQSFRYYKQYSVSNYAQHDFFTVAKGYVDGDTPDFDIDSRVEHYQKGRSMNLYNAFEWACTTDFRGNGMMTWAIFRYTFPRKMILDKWHSPICDNMLGTSDADIAESYLAWFTTDIGIILGPILSILYYSFYIWFMLFWGRIYAKLFKNNMLLLITYSMILSVCMNIEHNPVQDVKKYYSLWPYVFILMGIVYNIFKKPALRKK